MVGSGELNRYALLITRRIQAGEILIPGLNWRKTMRSHLTIKGLGLSISAVLAVPYVLVMLASLFLVGFHNRFLASSFFGNRMEHHSWI